MKVISVRHAAVPLPKANTDSTAWALLQDNEHVVDIDQFDNQLYLLIAKSPAVDLPEELFREGGDLDHEYLPDWVQRDENGLIERVGGETFIQALVRQWLAFEPEDDEEGL